MIGFVKIRTAERNLLLKGPLFAECYNRERKSSVSERREQVFRASATVGEWLSLVEHLVRDQGVGGSNPLSPTNLLHSICY